MKKIKDMKYFMEAPMHAFPRYSAILLALALSVPVVLAQDVEELEIAEEEETPVAETVEAQPEAELSEEEKDALRDQTSASIEELIARQAQKRNADELQEKARSAFEHEKYEVAVDLYIDVLKILESDVVDDEVPEANQQKIEELQNELAELLNEDDAETAGE